MNSHPGPNGHDTMRDAATAAADLEMRKRMCVAELQAVLEKYGMVAVSKEVWINGHMENWEMAVMPKAVVQAQGARVAVPPR